MPYRAFFLLKSVEQFENHDSCLLKSVEQFENHGWDQCRLFLYFHTVSMLQSVDSRTQDTLAMSSMKRWPTKTKARGGVSKMFRSSVDRIPRVGAQICSILTCFQEIWLNRRQFLFACVDLDGRPTGAGQTLVVRAGNPGTSHKWWHRRVDRDS